MVRSSIPSAALLAVLLTTVPARAAPGTVDASFGDGGKVAADFGRGDDAAQAIALLDDGRIVVAGRARGLNGEDVALMRLAIDGTLDSSFAGTGKLTTDLGGGADTGEAIRARSCPP